MVATPSAIAAPQRVVASNFFKVVLRKRRYSRCKCTDPRRLKALCTRHSRVARNGTSYIACRATTWQACHVENSTIQIDHVESYTDLEWPIDARNRRNVLCACFSHAQTRPEITPYPKSAHNGTSNSARNSGVRVRHGPLAHQNAQYLNQNMSPKRPVYIHTTAEKLCTRDLVTPKNASRDLVAVIRCS